MNSSRAAAWSGCSRVASPTDAVLDRALGLCFGIALTLPPLLVAPDFARTSAAMFTISYALAMAISVASGAAWDFTGRPAFAFLPIGLVVLPLVLLTRTVRFHRS